MATLVDWSLSDAILRRNLLHLSQQNLIKACKFQKVSYSGTKKDIIQRLIKANNTKSSKKKKSKRKSKIKDTHYSMNNKPKRNKLKDITIELLVFGYAHINEQTLSPPLNIIPLSIIQIFMKYYCIEGDLIIFLAVSQKLDINNPSYYKGFENKYKYIDFINNKTVTLKYHINNTYFDNHPHHNYTSIFAENIPIPSYLYSSQTNTNLDNDNKDNQDSFFFNRDSKYSAIIKNQTDIIYINNDEMNALSKSELDILNGYKASIPQSYSYNYTTNKCYLYSVNNGLIYFDTQKIQQLKFDTNIYNFSNWKWKQLASTKSKHENGSLCWIRGYSFTTNDSMSNEKIFICGGINGNSHCELYDIKNNKLISLQNMPNARTDSGCYFDKLNKNIYVGGGSGGSKYCVDCYDFNKNYWYSLCDTAFPHNNNPMLYMNGYILYIVGNGNAIGSIEMYDTRDSDGHWSFARDIQIDDILANDPCTIYKIMSNKNN